MAKLTVPKVAHKQMQKMGKWHIAKHFDDEGNVTTACNKIIWERKDKPELGVDTCPIKNLQAGMVCNRCWPFGVEE